MRREDGIAALIHDRLRLTQELKLDTMPTYPALVNI
jgi:hypothetical protein